jgi:hypothetical protein
LLKSIDELVKYSFDGFDVSVRPLHVDRRAPEPHRYAELGLEHAKVRAARAREPQQERGVGDFDVGRDVGFG